MVCQGKIHQKRVINKDLKVLRELDMQQSIESILEKVEKVQRLKGGSMSALFEEQQRGECNLSRGDEENRSERQRSGRQTEALVITADS